MKQIPKCKILKVNIAAINMDWIIQFLNENIRSLSGKYICVANVHTTVMSFEDEEYLNIQNNALMALPDGGPLSTVAKYRGYKDISRATGPSMMEELFKISNEKGYSHYFYGSRQETLDKLKIELEKNYPGIQIAGMYSPPFRSLTIEEDNDDIRRINESNADFIWIGLGAPKQEKWMALHEDKVKGLMVGVGAGFDYFAGNIQRAPMWMQKYNLEWVYRLMQEPRRLFKRYAETNTKFLWHAVLRGK